MNAEVIISQKLETSTKLVNTVCPYCGVGCGITAKVSNDKVIGVSGDVNHPTNRGRLCVKGSSLDETLGNKNRILMPRINKNEVTWEQATTTVANRLNTIISEHGPDSVAFYLSGQLLTEDYYVANKLMKGFIGSGNVDTNSRLCMASASTAHKRAFGEDIVPGCYDDFDHADVIFIVGSNTAYAHPIVYQRIIKAKEDNPALKIVVIDPRGTATSDTADVHLPIKAGTDGFYFNGLLAYLAQHDGIDNDFTAKHCDNLELALAAAKTQCEDLHAVAKICDVSYELLVQSYALFTEHKKVVTLFSQGINQSSSGVDKGNAIINCHLASSKMGYEGAGPFSITGQPNAMGGREVGGLATQLAAHLHFEQEGAVDLVERFWQAPSIAKKQGLKAVELFEAVEQGKIKAIWIMATNPVVSMPNADFIKRALTKCDNVIVSECYENSDTLKYANIVLPSTTWGEKLGTVTNSERRISLQQPLITPPGQAKNDWQIITEVASKMGFENAFNYEHPVDIFREHAALSGFENNYHVVDNNLEKSHAEESTGEENTGEENTVLKSTAINHRVFDISALADISQHSYENFLPIQWPVTANAPYGTSRIFSRKLLNKQAFVTNNGKAKLVAIKARLPKYDAKSNELIMNTGRIRDQWHTMTRTGRASKLSSHQSEPFIQVHPEDAEKFNLFDKQLAQLNNQDAKFIGRVHLTNQQRKGELFAPIHWNDQYSGSGRVSALVNTVTDPLCGQPEYKHSPVTVASYDESWSGYLLALTPIDFGERANYWTKINIDKGYKYLLAGKQELANDIVFVKSLFPIISDWLIIKEDPNAPLRIAGFINDVLQCFFVAGAQLNKQYDTRYIEDQLDVEHKKNIRIKQFSSLENIGLMDVGVIVCSCHQVGEKVITSAIKSGECNSVEALGAKLKCGTNCGSCIPELKKLIAKY